MKKQYRILRYGNIGCGIADQLALMAAKANTQDNPLTFAEMEVYFKIYLTDYPALSKVTFFNLLDENTLHIDYDRELALKIEEIEISECMPAEELTTNQARNFVGNSMEELFKDCPTLFTQDYKNN